MSSVAPEILRAFELEGAQLAPLGRGLINETFAADLKGVRWVLQRVNPIFDVSIHEGIEAVGVTLRESGIASPRLKRSRGDQLYFVSASKEVWRALERIEGTTFDTASCVSQLEGAARFVASWHAQLAGLKHEFVGQRLGVHDTGKHLEGLREALRAHPEHRLAASVTEIASQLETQLKSLPPLPTLVLPVAHGDLKLNNLLFEGDKGAAANKPRCLIDLDTMGPMLAAHELGDALRSWCNRANEDETQAQLDLEFYEGATQTYLEAYPEAQRDNLAEAMWLGADWVSLELTARFLADALNESYFGFDAERYAERGEHNLHRARGQWSMHLALSSSRAERLAMFQ